MERVMKNLKFTNEADLTANEIYDFLKFESRYEVLDENGNLVEMEDSLFENFLNNLATIDKFVSDVLASTEPAYRANQFFVYGNQLKLPKHHLEILPLAKYFTRVINLAHQLLPGYEYSHNIELFVTACRDLGLSQECFINPLSNSIKPGVRAVTFRH
jgi:hypothetical protein